jgi:CRISPR-associated protein Csx16
MKTYLVTRHIGAIEWLYSKGIKVDAQFVHLTDVNQFQAGDVVVGILPLAFICQLNQRGVVYLHISVTLPFECRGKELTSAMLEQYQAKLERFDVVQTPVDLTGYIKK